MASPTPNPNEQHVRAMGLDPALLGTPFEKKSRSDQVVLDRLAEGHPEALADRVLCKQMTTHPEHSMTVGEYQYDCPGIPEPTKQREGDQRLPDQNDFDDIQSQVIADIEERRQVGISRYGTALQPFNGRKTLLDAYEESLDQTVYLRSLLTMQEAQRDTLVAVVQDAWLVKHPAWERSDAQALAEVAVDAIIDAFAGGVVSSQ